MRKYGTVNGKCEQCGSDFKGTRARRFCSDSCRVSFNYKRKVFKRNCLFCGDSFTSSSSGKLYCSTTCRQKNRYANRGTVSRKCVTCGNDFIPTVRLRKYCSKECVLIANKKEPSVYIKKCVECGNNYTSHSKNQKYCSKRCSSKNKHRNKDSKNKRKSKCECCGFSILEALHYHHINRTKSLGGITLCANCHYIFHRTYGNSKNLYERDNKEQVLSDINKILVGHI